METFIGEAIILEATLASVLLALWMTWLALRGLFWLIPIKDQTAQPVRSIAIREAGNRRRNAA